MKDKVMMVIVLVAVSVISALMLAGINDFSYDVIKTNKERKLKVSVLSALEIPFSSEGPEKAFNEMVSKVDSQAGPIYLSRNGGKEIEGAAFSVKGPGFWGPIVVMVGIDPEEMTIKGIEILQQEETPGLGARIEEDWFRNQFKDKSITSPIAMMIKGAAPGYNDVSAIAGATLSSKFIETIINEKSKPYLEAIGSLDLG